MKILFVSHEPKLYGAQKALLELAKDLKSRYNITPIILVPSLGDLTLELEKSCIEFIVCKYYWWMDTNDLKGKLKSKIKKILNKVSLFRMYNIVNKYNVDIIHTNTSVIDIGYHLSKKLNIYHVWHIREDSREAFNLRYNVKKNKVEQYYKEAKKIIFVSNFVKEKHSDLVDKNNIEIVYDGINIDTSFTKKFNLDNQKKLQICMVGSITENKNQIEVIKAIKLLEEQGLKNVYLNIIGDGDEKYIKNIKSFIKENNLNKYVKLWGYKNNIDEILRNMDLGIMASKNEAFGLVTVEYMSKYMPVIGANVGATKEIIKDRFNGMLYNLGDTEDLSNKIIYFMMERDELKHMGENAYQTSRKKFYNKINTDKIYKIYNSIYSN